MNTNGFRIKRIDILSCAINFTGLWGKWLRWNRREVAVEKMHEHFRTRSAIATFGCTFVFKLRRTVPFYTSFQLVLFEWTKRRTQTELLSAFNLENSRSGAWKSRSSRHERNLRSLTSAWPQQIRYSPLFDSLHRMTGIMNEIRTTHFLRERIDSKVTNLFWIIHILRSEMKTRWNFVTPVISLTLIHCWLRATKWQSSYT